MATQQHRSKYDVSMKTLYTWKAWLHYRKQWYRQNVTKNVR